MRNYFLVILKVFYFFSGFAQNSVSPLDIRTDATFENISIYYSINGDDNLNSSLSVSFRENGSNNPFLQAAPAIRAYPGLIINGTTVNFNYHACSALLLKPGTEYELRITLSDPDGGGTVSTITATTKLFPVETSNYRYCISGTGGGDGSIQNPWRGLQTAADNVRSGETVLVADGIYNPFVLNTSGSPDSPITFRAENGRKAIIDANGSTYCIRVGSSTNPIRHIIIDGFLLLDADNGGSLGLGFGVQSDNGSFITMKNCKTNGCNYGFGAFQENGYDGDCWIYNNEFIGNDAWQTTAHTNYDGVLVCGNNNVVSYNTISYFCDGIRSSSASEGLTNAVYSIDVHNNDIRSCEDDLIEMDKTYSNVRVYENRCFNTLTAISAQPIYGGPFYAFRNLIYNCESTTMKWANTPAGLVFVNNTMCSNSSAFTNKEPFKNAIVKNNLVIADGAVQNWTSEESQSTIKEFDFNAYYSGSGYTDYTFGRWGSNTYYEGLSNVYTGTGYEQNSIGSNPSSDIEDWGSGFPSEQREYNPVNFNFNPTSGSNLRNSGLNIPGFHREGATPDIGCYQFGESMPVYGVVFDNGSPVLGTIGDKTIIEGNTMDIQVSSIDSDGDSRRYIIEPALDFVIFTDNQNGTGLLRLEPEIGDAGSYKLTITVIDINDASDFETINIEVIQQPGDINSNPLLSPINDQRIIEGSKQDVSLFATDADEDIISFSISPQLNFITIIDNRDGTGLMTFSPEPGDAGIYNMVVMVSDANNGMDSKTFLLIVDKVENGNTVPVLNAIDDQIVNEGETVDITLNASDADGDGISYLISPEVDFINISDLQNGTAILTITPKVGDAGKYYFTVTVTDANNSSNSKVFALIINDNINSRYTNIINSGGTSLALGSILAREDRYFIGGQTATRPPNYIIEGTDEDPLYQSLRYGDFSYDIPVPENGLYTVRLHFAETYLIDGASGKRVFNVDIENEQESLINYDINADAGPMKAAIKTFTGIDVKDKHLTIDVKTVVRNAIISAVEFISETDKITSIESVENRSKISVYPNPSNGILYLELPQNQHAKNSIPYFIYDISGEIVYQSTLNTLKEMIDLSNIKKGMYIIKLGGYQTEKIIIY